MFAERVGFEPTNRLPDLHLSRVLHYRSAIFPYLWRGAESNRRPPGHEPGELPLLHRAVWKTNRADRRAYASIGSVALWLTIFLTSRGEGGLEPPTCLSRRPLCQLSYFSIRDPTASQPRDRHLVDFASVFTSNYSQVILLSFFFSITLNSYPNLTPASLTPEIHIPRPPKILILPENLRSPAKFGAMWT